MARNVETTCTAWVKIGTPESHGILSCSRWGDGKCLKDLRTELRAKIMDIDTGVCEADEREKSSQKKQ